MSKATGSEITVTLHHGLVSFSFKTDAKGSNLREMLAKITELIGAAADVLPSGVAKGGDQTPGFVQSDVTLSALRIPKDIEQSFVSKIRSVSNWDTTLLLLYYGSGGLTNKQLRSLSEELGKPISFSWFDTEFHRRRSEGLVKSKTISGSKEKVYVITELGKKRLQKLTENWTAEERPAEVLKTTRPSGTKSILHERILELCSEGFFKEPRSVGELRAELRNRGYAYTLGSLGMALLALTRKKELRRLLDKRGDRTLYLYTMP